MCLVDAVGRSVGGVEKEVEESVVELAGRSSLDSTTRKH